MRDPLLQAVMEKLAAKLPIKITEKLPIKVTPKVKNALKVKVSGKRPAQPRPVMTRPEMPTPNEDIDYRAIFKRINNRGQ